MSDFDKRALTTEELAALSRLLRRHAWSYTKAARREDGWISYHVLSAACEVVGRDEIDANFPIRHGHAATS